MAKGIYVYQQIVKTTSEWESNTDIFPQNVWLFEKLDNGRFNLAISDGVHTYAELQKIMSDISVVVKTDTDTQYILTITTSSGSFDTPNLKGKEYIHPKFTEHEAGLYKITVNDEGHVSDATAVTKADITGLGIPAQDTTYSEGTGLSFSGTTINHASSITSGTAGSSSSTSGTNTISIPYVTYNDTGHVTEAGTHTHTINEATTSASGLMSSSDKTKMDRLESYTTATTVASLDVNYQIIYVTLSENASLSASDTGTTYNGRSITVYVYTSSEITITIPTSGDYVSMCGSSFTTTADGWVEFSLVCVNGVWHIAKLEAE